MFSFLKTLTKRSRTRVTAPRARLTLEVLESRLVPYALSGGSWVHPESITISFVPDGTVLGHDGTGAAILSTMFHDFSIFGSAATWQKPIEKAAQVWAQQTNINFSVVSDNGADIGTGSYQQGDPGFGDIRIGGYKEGTSGGQPLASAYMPPQLNNYSIAGDITFNTSQAFNIGSTFDLYTVAAHEMGHALGLNHSADTTAIMTPAYTGTFTGLASDDTNGIRAIYSSGAARAKDAFDNAAANSTFATASSITVDPVLDTVLVTGLDISTTTDVDMYKFTAPTGSGSSMTVSVQSSGLSLLSPKLYVYDATQHQIGFASGAGVYGTTLTVTASITAGQQYYVKVQGAETTAFGTGAYALVVNTGTGTSPTVPLPNTLTANGSPLQTGGGQIDSPGDHGHNHHGDGDRNDDNSSFFLMPASSSQDSPQILIGSALGDSFYPNGDPVTTTTDSAPRSSSGDDEALRSPPSAIDHLFGDTTLDIRGAFSNLEMSSWFGSGTNDN